MSGANMYGWNMKGIGKAAMNFVCYKSKNI